MTETNMPAELPGLAADADPEFVDTSSCSAWLENVPLANVGAAQQQLLAQVAEFNRFPTKSSNRFAVPWVGSACPSLRDPPATAT